MPNPFDDDSARFLVLVNTEGQYSLWPAFSPVPEGWEIDLGESSRRECLDRIDQVWTDMRPLSLIAAMKG